MSSESQILLTKTQTADTLAISLGFLERLVRRGDIRPLRCGGRVLFLRSEVERFVHELARMRRPSRRSLVIETGTGALEVRQ